MSETARRQKDVEHAYSVLQAQCTRWRELYPGQNYDDKEELEWLEEQIDEQTKAVKTNLDKFKKFASSNGSVYLSDSDERFVSRIEKQLRDTEELLRGGAPRIRQPSKSSSSWLDKNSEAPKDYFIEGEKQLQQETMKVQDAQLDSLSQTVRRLGEIGMTISDELTTQDRVLNDIHDDIDRTSTKLSAVNKRVTKLLKSQGKGRICCVIWLIVVLIVLIVVFFTL